MPVFTGFTLVICYLLRTENRKIHLKQKQNKNIMLFKLLNWFNINDGHVTISDIAS